jgi:membrane protein YdbS with pleckstrin-like domain
MRFKGLKWDLTLFLIFMALKVFGIINWSWWWVTSPLWIPLAGVILVTVVAIILTIIFGKPNV